MNNFNSCEKLRYGVETKQTNFLENTSYYIRSYLNPRRKWNRSTSGKQRIDWVQCADVDWTAVSGHIRNMKYTDFLATPYWKAIAAHTKYRAGYRCQLCNSGNNLTTHHRNYDIHGREHAHINELIVLCNHCHQKFHGFKKKEPFAKSGSAMVKARLIIFGLGLLNAYLLLLVLWGS